MLISTQKTKVAYIGPECVFGIAAAWDNHVMWDDNGRKFTYVEAINFHMDNVDKVVRFNHENDADPTAVAYDVADALDTQDGTYFIAVDAHERAADGKRMLARVIVRCGDGVLGRRELTLPWEAGAPELDLDTLLKAGLPREQAKKLIYSLDIREEPENAPQP